MELRGTKGEKWISEREPQGVHVLIWPSETMPGDGILDVFNIGLAYASVALSIKAIENGGIYSVSDKSARVGSSDGQIYIESELLHQPGKYYRNSLGSEESVRFLKYLKDIMLGKSTSAEVSRKVGRNELCPCGSGKKYKRCCEKKENNLPPDKLAFVKDIQDEHVSQFIMIAERDPSVLSDANFWEELGGIIGSAGAHKQAEEAFRRALKLNPDSQFAKMNLAVTLGIRGDSSKALELIDSLPDNTNRKAVTKANILRDLERYDEAIYLYEKAIAEEPSFTLPYVSILHCLRQTKSPLLEFWIERAVKSLPKDPSVALQYAHNLYVTGQLDQLAEADWIDNLEARDDVDFSIVGRGEDGQRLIACAQLWRKIGYVSRDNDLEQLEHALNLLEVLGPMTHVCDQARVLTVLASNLGKPDAVERAFKWIHETCRSCEYGSEELEAYLGVGNCEAGNYEKGIVYIEVVLKTYPDDKKMLWSYWWSLDEVGRIQDAIEVAERLYYIDPTTQDLEYNLGYMCGKVGNIATAREYYNSQIRRMPEHWQSLENNSFLALLDFDVEGAIDLFDQFLSNFKLSINSYSESETEQEVDDWIRRKREKFTQLLDLARSNSRSKSYSRDIIRANEASQPKIGADKACISRHMFSIEDVIAAIEDPQNPHAKEVLRQHKAVQRGDRSVVISFLEDHIPAWNWLPESSQNSLVESEMRFKDGQTLDYAPVVVGFAKAVEVTLKHKVFDVFKEKYTEKIEIFKYTQLVLQEKDSKVYNFALFIEKGRHLELGGMVLVLRFCTGKTAKKVSLVARFRDFIIKELVLPQFLDMQFLEKCDSLSGLRNPAAHEVTHDRQIASKARDLTFDVLGELQK